MNLSNLFSGILSIMIGVFFKIYSNFYDFGTLSNMGPGYFPNIISTVIIILGILLVIRSWKL